MPTLGEFRVQFSSQWPDHGAHHAPFHGALTATTDMGWNGSWLAASDRSIPVVTVWAGVVCVDVPLLANIRG